MSKKLVFSLILSAILASCSSSKETKKDGTYLAKLSGLPQLEVKNENETAVYANPNGDVISIAGDDTFTTTYKKNAYKLQVKKCNDKDLPPVWFRYYDGPNTFANDNFEEISFDMPVTKNGLPAIYNLQSLWDQMTIFQPMPVFEDLAPTYCGFYGAKTLWANGGINFELTAGNTGFDLGDATAITVWNSPWKAGFNDTLYQGWTVYPIMALGNGAGGVPAGYAFRIPSASSPDDVVHCKYTILNDKQIVIQELSYKGATTKYAIPQQLFKDKFLPQAIANGDMAANDKQVDQVKNFDWRWLLFTTTLTIQKPVDPDGKLITLDELKQYFPKTSAYQNIKLKVKGFEGINNPKAFKNTLKCELGLEMYGTLWDNRVFTDLKGYSKWLATEADKQDPRFAHWRCVEAIARSREQRCVATGSEKNSAGIPWNVENGYLNEEYPEECDCNNPKTKAIIDGLRKQTVSASSVATSGPSDKLPSWLLGIWMREWIRKPGVKIQDPNAVQESPQLVRYLQTPKFFGDMRYPVDRPKFQNAKSFDDLTDSDLQILAKQQGFIGYTTVENPDSSTPTETIVQWHRQMDFEPPTSNLDIGKLELLSKERMNESALDNAYTEHWVSLTNGDGRFLVVHVEREGRIDRMLLVAGDQFYYGRNRAKNLPSAASFEALTSQASRDQIIEYLDFELSVGRIRGGLVPWEIQYSTIPWREGMHLDFVDRIQGNGPTGGLAPQSETGETWTVPINTLDPKDLDFLFPNIKKRDKQLKNFSHEQEQVGPRATLLTVLPDTCNTPDGMCLLPDNSIIVSIPNFNEENPKLKLKASGGRLIKITPDNKVQEFYIFPNPYPGYDAPINHIRPFGIARAPSGSLYFADLQYFSDKNQKSRIWRLDLKNGQVNKMTLVASGLNVANGLAIHDGYLYVTESVLIEGSDPLISAVLRFRLDEEHVKLKTPLKDDPHVFTTFRSTTANSKKWAFGADGIAFDSKGNLFVGLFGDGIIYKAVFNKMGTVLSNTLFAKAPGQMINCDGMSCDMRTDKLYVADSANNAIQVIHPNGMVETLSMNGVVSDKASKISGLLVQPCEALVRGDTIVVSNMDWPFADFKNEKIGHQQPATLSVIPFKK